MKINYYRLFIFALSFHHLNRYFGWNVSPKSDSELIGDMILFLLLSISFQLKEKGDELHR